MPTEERRDDDEGPRRTVNIDSFQLMTTEVTQQMWEEVMGGNPSYFVSPDRPVENVSWEDVQLFIEELNYMDPDHTYRLPTEAEWEYACRAGTTTRYYWGDSDSESVMGMYCWCNESEGDENFGSSTHPVGTKEPNAWGLYDMSGNVWEWCQDVYTSDYGDCPTNGSAYTGSGSSRVRRGGSWGNDARRCRSADRCRLSPGSRYSHLGFRLARS